MENSSGVQPLSEAQNPKTKRKVLVSKKLIICIAAVVLVLASLWGLYTYAYGKGEKAGEKNTKDTQASQANDRLLALPASGEVSKVSDKEIEVKLLGDEVRKAKITKDTQVTGKSGKLSAKDIEQGGRVILFTKKDGNDLVATRIVVQ